MSGNNAVKIHLEYFGDRFGPVRPAAAIRRVDDHGNRIHGCQQVADRDGVLRGLEQPGTVWASFCSTQGDAGYTDRLLRSPVPEP